MGNVDAVARSEEGAPIRVPITATHNDVQFVACKGWPFLALPWAFTVPLLLLTEFLRAAVGIGATRTRRTPYRRERSSERTALLPRRLTSSSPMMDGMRCVIVLLLPREFSHRTTYRFRFVMLKQQAYWAHDRIPHQYGRDRGWALLRTTGRRHVSLEPGGWLLNLETPEPRQPHLPYAPQLSFPLVRRCVP